MPWSLLTLPMLLPAYLLVLFRVGGLVVAAPMFGSSAVPARVRAMFAAAIAMVLFPMLLPTVPANLTLHAALVGLVGEMMIGVLMGLALDALFLGAELAGSVIGQQAGLSLGQTYNPLMKGESTTLGQLHFIVLFFVFIAAGGHRALIEGLLDSFQTVPLLSFVAGESHVTLIADLLQGSLVLGLKLAGPALIAMFMTTVTMGFLSRTMPQLNILTVGFIVRILVVLLIAGIALSVSGGVLSRACYDTILKVRILFGLT